MRKTRLKPTGSRDEASRDREMKILNIMSNISILLMSVMTEAFSAVFSEMTEGLVQSLTTSLGVSEKEAKKGSDKFQELKTKIPQQVIEQMAAMKADIKAQLQGKQRDIESLIANPSFDEGIRIAERYKIGLPTLTQDLDELSLLGYLTLLKANDPTCTKMFQELMEWMKTVPQPSDLSHEKK